MICIKPLKKLVAATLAVVALGSIGSQAFAFNTDRIMNVIKFPNNWGHHKVLISHRGIIRDGCPENSSCSIQNTLQSGFVESIELDVKAASDGSLWLMHDQNMGRMTSVGFDIFSGKGGSNQDIRTVSSSTLENTRLKDRRFIVSGYYMQTLLAALRKTNGIVSILDLKSDKDAVTAAGLVRVLGAQNRVILKVSAGWHTGNPGSVGNRFGGVPFAVTLYTPDLDRIVDNYRSAVCISGSGCAPRFVVTEWIDKAIKSNAAGFMFLEIGNKDLHDGDPLFSFVTGYQNSLVATSQFIPVPEYPQPGPYRQLGYVRSNSTCCASLSKYLGTSNYFGRESYDARPNLISNGNWTYYDSLLTDDVTTLHNTMKASGYRHMEYYQ